MLTADSTPADMIRAAVSYIDEHGWAQGAFTEMNSSVCMMGGYYTAHVIGAATHETAQTGISVLFDYFESAHGCSVMQFNDTPGREWDECRKHMLLAAEAWERGELR